MNRTLKIWLEKLGLVLIILIGTVLAMLIGTTLGMIISFFINFTNR